MNVWVLYESRLGNTAQLAEAMAQAMTQWARVRLLTVNQADTPSGVHLLLIGIPSHRHSRPNGALDWVRRLPSGALNGVWVSVFEIRYEPLRWLQVSPTWKIGRALLRRGGRYAAPPESFFLTGHEGPIAEGEILRGCAWATQMIHRLMPVPPK